MYFYWHVDCIQAVESGICTIYLVTSISVLVLSVRTVYKILIIFQHESALAGTGGKRPELQPE